MRRRLYLEFIGTNPPMSGYMVKPGGLAINLNLKNAFHNGYIEVHGSPPRNGTNPLFDEYSNLLTNDIELRFKSPGIANDDDLRGGVSHILGRIFARAYLNEHHKYRWFAHFSNLVRAKMRGWSVEPVNRGDTPDWLITKSGSAALAEAKGTHSNITNGSPILDNWRVQAINARVKKNDLDYTLKSWIIATRWITSDQPRTHPKIYVEDPIINANHEFNDDDLSTIELNAASIHVSLCLHRLQQRRLATRLEIGNQQKEVQKIKVPLWRCVLPQLVHLRFVGVPRLEISGPTLSWLLFSEFILRSTRLFHEQLMHINTTKYLGSNAFFDGIDFRTVDALLNNRVPDLFEDVYKVDSFPDDVSFLSDGSLIAPMDLMEPLEVIDVL